MTLTVTFDLRLKNFNIPHNFLIVRDRTIIFGMNYDHDDKTFPMVLFYDAWPSPSDGSVNFEPMALSIFIS